MARELGYKFHCRSKALMVNNDHFAKYIYIYIYSFIYNIYNLSTILKYKIAFISSESVEKFIIYVGLEVFVTVKIIIS
jgi:hypothetical protein